VKNKHTEIAYIGGPRGLSTGNARNDAYLEASKIHGIDAKSENIIFSDKYSEDEGSKCADLLLEKNPAITAILCANDRLAIGALESLAERGLECPKDISITGFNDIPMSDRIPPGLTTVRVLQFDVGRIAAELLLKKISQTDLAVPETTIMPVTVIERGSVSLRV
jgi:LacI family transcriptional regulator